MQDPAFIKLIGVELDQSQTRLHQLFITALEAWAKLTPLGKGLPVGLPASAVVANAALFKLDQFIEQQVVPLYYGRYVDDILLVMENTSKIKIRISSGIGSSIGMGAKSYLSGNIRITQKNRLSFSSLITLKHVPAVSCLQTTK